MAVNALSLRWPIKYLNRPSSVSTEIIGLPHYELAGLVISPWSIFWNFFAAYCLDFGLHGTEHYETDMCL